MSRLGRFKMLIWISPMVCIFSDNSIFIFHNKLLLNHIILSFVALMRLCSRQSVDGWLIMHLTSCPLLCISCWLIVILHLLIHSCVKSISILIQYFFRRMPWSIIIILLRRCLNLIEFLRNCWYLKVAVSVIIWLLDCSIYYGLIWSVVL